MKPAEDYIFRQPEMYREMLLHIVAVVEYELRDTELLFKWGIPYFYYKKKSSNSR